MTTTTDERVDPLTPNGIGSAHLVDEAGLQAAVRSLLVAPHAGLGRWRIDPIDHDLVAATTEALYRARGVTTDGAPWRLFGKVLRSFRHWPVLQVLPPDLRDRALRDPAGAPRPTSTPLSCPGSSRSGHGCPCCTVSTISVTSDSCSGWRTWSPPTRPGTWCATAGPRGCSAAWPPA